MNFKKYTDWLKKKKFFIAAIILVAAGGGYYYFSQQSDTTTTVPKVATVERGDLRVTVTGSGQVEATNQVDLKSVAAGDAADVTAVLVQNDQEVKKGQIIATIDSTDASQEVRSAQLSVQSAEVKMKQTKNTFDNETVEDKYERQNQEISLQQSKITLAKAQEKLQDYTIRAPFDGIVTGLSVSAGDALANDTIIASVITEEMRVAVTLNEVDAVKVAEGMEVNLTFDAIPNTEIKGKVTKIDTIGTTESGVVSYGAEITLNEQNSQLKPGMSASAEIIVSEKKDVVLVPNEALITEDGKTYVQIAGAERSTEQTAQTPPRIQRKEVQVGITDDVSSEILEGLSAGDRIIAGTQTTSDALTSRNTSGFSLFGGPGGGARSGNFQPR